MKIIIQGEIHCEECNVIVHNHLDCPVCNKKNEESDSYSELEKGDIIECNCGAKFRILSELVYGDYCEVELIKE